MPHDDNQILAFKEIANQLLEVFITDDFGEKGIAGLRDLIDLIHLIQKSLNRKSSEPFYIFKPVDDKEIIPTLGIGYTILHDYNSLASLDSNNLVIEIKANKELFISQSDLVDVDAIRGQAIIYRYHNQIETFLGKTDNKVLPFISNNESYFAINTYKSLEEAIEKYKTNKVLYSNCEFLSDAWFDVNTKIFFVPGPEHFFRDSLHDYLKTRIRENVQVLREQNVDLTHPVDIRVKWNYSNHTALIEVKWVGMSYDKIKNKVAFKDIDSAVNGASQLVGYIDKLKKEIPDSVIVGYLVVFDGRRNINKNFTAKISQHEGLHYQHDEIEYYPEYHQTRQDFSKPVRFFMRPQI